MVRAMDHAVQHGQHSRGVIYAAHEHLKAVYTNTRLAIDSIPIHPHIVPYGREI